jgi:hypothetical protein
MALPRILRNFTCFIDGVGWAGLVEECTPPTLTIKTEEYEGGGMAGPVDLDMGAMEKLEGEITFAEYNPVLYRHLGVPDLPITIRGAQVADGTTESVIYQMRCLMKQMDPGGMKRGDSARLKCAFTATYVKVSIDSSDVIEVDMVNMIRRVGAIDQLEQQRRALGI